MSFFPSSVPTALQLLDARNNKSVTLTGNINDVVTTIPVNSTSDIPTAGYLTFEDGSNEVIQYTGVTPTTLTGVTRGADGTTASSHSNGGTIGMWGNAKYHNVLSEEIVAITQNLSDRLGLSATQILAPLGSAVAPSYSFMGIPSKGMYSISTRIGFAIGGVQIMRIGSDGVSLEVGTFLGQAGSVTLPTYSWAADDNTGLYNSAADEVSLGTAGVQRWVVDSGGRMGLGTASPISYNSNARQFVVASSTGSTGITIRSGTNNSGILAFTDAEGTTVQGLIQYTHNATAANEVMIFRIGSTDHFTLGGGGQMFSPLGSASLPTYSYNGDGNTGMFSPSADSIGFSTNGVLRVTIDNSGLTVNSGVLTSTIQFADGSAAAPSITFTSDTDTGMFRQGANTIGWSTNGSQGLSFSTGSQFTLLNATPLRVGDGSAGTPSISFDSDQDTGIYRAGSNQLNFSTGGVLRFGITTGDFNFSTESNLNALNCRLEDGSAASPSFTFTNDTNTGMFRQGADVIGWACNGAQHLALTTGQLSPGGTDGTMNLGSGSARWNTVFATNSTINTSHSSTKENITDIDPASVEIPRGILFDRGGRRFMGYLNDNLPSVCRPIEDGHILETMNYENAVVGILCAHVRKLEDELADLKSKAKFN